MRKGLALIIIGHINFIFGAIVHGSILRHISKPSQQISTEYTVTNIISVTSGLLVSQWFSFCVLKSNEHVVNQATLNLQEFLPSSKHFTLKFLSHRAICNHFYISSSACLMHENIKSSLG